MSTADPSDYVEFEKTDATPVESSDNCEDKSDSIHYHNNVTVPFGCTQKTYSDFIFEKQCCQYIVLRFFEKYNGKILA